MPHMHWRGKDFLYELKYPDGRTETLLSVPQYDFAWQNTYRLEQPVKVPKGSTLHCVAHFDNSKDNPANPDPEEGRPLGRPDLGRNDDRLGHLLLERRRQTRGRLNRGAS